MTTQNFITALLKSKGIIQFRVENQTTDYTFRIKDKKEFVTKMIWSGAKHDITSEEDISIDKAVAEIINTVEKPKIK